MIFIELKKNLFIGLNLLFAVILFGCADPDIKFKENLDRALDGGSNREVNARLRKIFEEEYGIKKAKEEGLKYCRQLKQGQKLEDIMAENILKPRASEERNAHVKLVRIYIYDAAENAYCPEQIFFR